MAKLALKAKARESTQGLWFVNLLEFSP